MAALLLSPATGFLAAALAVATVALVYLCYEVLWGRQEKLRRRLRQQGIGGPLPRFFYGNISEMERIAAEEKARREREGVPVASDYGVTLFPYFERWREQYGPIFTYSTGSIQIIYLSHPDIVKEIGQCKSWDLGKPAYLQKERGPLFGRGILTSNGAVWAHQRKVIAPEFFMEKVKGMVDMMVAACVPMLESWEGQIHHEAAGGEIVVDEDLRNYSADVISRACFGSSYAKGKEIFSKVRTLQMIMSKKSLLIGIPGRRHLPTKSNRDIWKLNREIRSLILGVVAERKEKPAASHEKDLLQSILENANSGYIGNETAECFIVDNCKNIYFAGHETTAVSATWCLMLLALYPEWQDRVREEVVEILGGQLPDAVMLKKMKGLTMVINEALRLYPPASSISRESLQDLKLGGIHIPKGLTIWVPISVMLHDPEIWGPDANEFKPERFSNGISGACKFPHVYIPFGLGPRTCAGQNLAIVELKIVLSLIVSKFSFSLSPKYRHSPVFRMIIEPGFGVPLIMKKI